MANEQGRRVFLLNPPSVVEQDLIEALLAAEYEVYLLKDPERARTVFARYPDSIAFIGIDSRYDESEWQRYIRGLLSDKATGDLRIGVLSYNNDRALAEKYLMEIGAQCGFVALKTGMQESTRIMLRALEANEARGRRRYVRARCAEDRATTFNVTLPTGSATGRVLDISSVGMAARFSSYVDLPAKTVLRDIQLKLHATLVHVDGVILGRREDDAGVYIVIFQYRKGEQKPRHQIRRFIHAALQRQIDSIA